MLSFLSSSYIGGTTSHNRPSNAAEAFGPNTLVRGSAGNAVANVQIGLVELGFLPDVGSSVDGAFGGNTENAVKAFQTWINGSYGANLAFDGKVGPATKTWLWSEAGYRIQTIGQAL